MPQHNISLIVDGVIYDCTPQVKPLVVNVNHEVYKPLFLDVAEFLHENEIPPSVEWVAEGLGGTGVTTLEGFNAAFFWETTGDFTISVHVTYDDRKAVTKEWLVKVRKPIKNAVRLAPGDITGHLDMPAANTYYVLDPFGVYTVSRPVTVKASLITLKGAPATITYTGPRTPQNTAGKPYTPTILTLEQGVVLYNLMVRTPFDHKMPTSQAEADYEKHNTPNGIFCKGGNAIVRCYGSNLGTFINLNNSPTHILQWLNRTDESLRNYHCWVQGDYISIYECDAADSIYEHCVRISRDAKFLAINYCTFTNVADPANKWNIAKGTITRQDSEWTYTFSNSLIGPSGMGPLGEKDGIKSPGDRTRYAVSRSDHVTGEFILKHGLEYFMVDELSTDQFTIVGSQPTYAYPADRKIKHGMINNCMVRQSVKSTKDMEDVTVSNCTAPQPIQ